jgi:5-(carboxyamino)imidazole ribonucleotide mutase
MSNPLVGVVMGSSSDWEVMKHAVGILRDFDVTYEAEVVSAHRTPDRMFDYAETAVNRIRRTRYIQAAPRARLPPFHCANA